MTSIIPLQGSLMMWTAALVYYLQSQYYNPYSNLNCCNIYSRDAYSTITWRKLAAQINKGIA